MSDYDTETFCTDCGAVRQCREGEPDGFGFAKYHCRACDDEGMPAFPIAGKVVLLFVLGFLAALYAYLTMPKG